MTTPSSKALDRDSDELARHQEMRRERIFSLTNLEMWWRDRATFLESRGYRLRPRFRPGWEPSWSGRDLSPLFCEDGQFHVIRKVMDATKISDGRKVAIKQVPTGTPEVDIGSMLSTPESLKDPTNHCVPVLDHFSDPKEPDITYIVMPLLLPYDNPEFYDISEMLDFMSQLLEGVVYIHGRSVAHRDLSYINIMMLGDKLYPRGFHPSDQRLLPNAEDDTKPLRRREVGYVKYYIVDFGLSLCYDDPDMPRMTYGRDGQDQEVPELHTGEPYDPFKVDIYTLGNQIQKTFLDKYTNVDFVSPLVKAMVDDDPAKRPSAEEALAQFRQIRKRIGWLSALRRLRKKDETERERRLRNIHSVILLLILPFVYLLGYTSRALRSLLSRFLRQSKSILSRKRRAGPSAQSSLIPS